MVAEGCASKDELRGRDLFFGYPEECQQALAEAVVGPVKWLAEYEDFVYPEDHLSKWQARGHHPPVPIGPRQLCHRSGRGDLT